MASILRFQAIRETENGATAFVIALLKVRPLLARAKCVIRVWVSFNEHKWVNFDER
jgi:hypothetical protein